VQFALTFGICVYSTDIFIDTASDSTLAIHREAPPFVDQSTEMEMLVTGIKVG